MLLNCVKNGWGSQGEAGGEEVTDKVQDTGMGSSCFWGDISGRLVKRELCHPRGSRLVEAPRAGVCGAWHPAPFSESPTVCSKEAAPALAITSASQQQEQGTGPCPEAAFVSPCYRH